MGGVTLHEKVIVIIGGTTGLGFSAAKACVEAGAKVVVVGRNPHHAEEAESALGDAARKQVGDASEPGTAAEAIRTAIEQLGGFHGLYHVAGGSGRRMGDGPLHEISDEGWEATIRLNLTSLFLSNRAAAQQFLRQGTGGSILDMSSVLGFSPSPRYFATHAYAAAKAAALERHSAARRRLTMRRRASASTSWRQALVETPMSGGRCRIPRDHGVHRHEAAARRRPDRPAGRPRCGGGLSIYSDAARFVTVGRSNGARFNCNAQPA